MCQVKLKFIKIGSQALMPRRFYWSDGSVVNANYFIPGNPDNYMGTATTFGQGCLVLWPIGIDDDYCISLFNFFCEIIY